MKIQFDEFCNQVLEHIPRATHAEQEQIRAELLGHLEDKAEALREKGIEEADAAAVAAMGSVAEIGSAWNEQLSTLWLWIGRLGWMLRVLLCAAICMALFYNVIGLSLNFQGYLETRLGDLSHIASEETEYLIWTEAIDYRMELRDNVVRFHRVRLERSETVEGGYDLVLCMVSYAKNPLREVPAPSALQRITCSAADEPFAYDGENTSVPLSQRSNAIYWYERVSVDQISGTVTITAEHYGQIFTMDVELGGVA